MTLSFTVPEALVRLRARRGWLRTAALLTSLGAFVVILGGCGGGGAAAPAAPTLTSIAVTPGNTSILQGTAQQFKATGTYSDNNTKDLTAAVNWVSTTSVVTINSVGLASSVGPGTTTITAASGSISGSTTLTVTSLFTQYIQHVVVIFQENRTPDNLFHGLPGADIVLRLLNGKNGKPLRDEHPNIWLGDAPGINRKTDANGEITVDVSRVQPRTIMVLGNNYVDCRPRGSNKLVAMNVRYPLDEIIAKGIVTENDCGKSQVDPIRGVLVLYLRPMTFIEK